MYSRWSVSVAAVLLLALTGIIGCGGGNSSATPTGPSPTAKSLQATNAIAIEPVALRPEFLPGTSCLGYPPFGMHFNLIVFPSPYGRYVNAVSFSYLDGRGVRGVPFVTPGQVQGGTTSTAIPTTGPVPIPTQISSIFVVNPSSRAVAPYAIRFNCGYAPFGLLSIGVDMTDGFGTPPIHAEIAVNVRK